MKIKAGNDKSKDGGGSYTVKKEENYPAPAGYKSSSNRIPWMNKNPALSGYRSSWIRIGFRSRRMFFLQCSKVESAHAQRPFARC